MTYAMVITPATMFAHRFAPCFSTRDSTIMAIGISVTIAAPNKKPGVTWTPPAYPVRTSLRVPGYMNERMSAKTMLNMMNIHNVESLSGIPGIPAVRSSVVILHSILERD